MNNLRETDWKFDFSTLPYWDNREKFLYVYDKFHYIAQSDVLCCIYSIVEVSMLNYVGFLAILKNKDNPELVLNVTKRMNFCDNFSVSQSGNIIFLQPSIYCEETNILKRPILIIDIDKRRFSYFNTKNHNPSYKVVELSDHIFGIEADEIQKKGDKYLYDLSKQKIDLHNLNWYGLDELNALPDML